MEIKNIKENTPQNLINKIKAIASKTNRNKIIYCGCVNGKHFFHLSNTELLGCKVGFHFYVENDKNEFDYYSFPEALELFEIAKNNGIEFI